MYETINSPINYGGLELKNRIIFAPTTFGLAEDEYFEKIRKIAAGGCAMVIIGDVPVGKSQFEKSLFDKKGFAYYQKLAEIVHSYNCRICAQLHQSDSNMLAMLKYVPGVLTKKISMEELRPLLNAEVAPYISKLSTRKIHKIINGFGEAAVLAVKAGFDMVQVHGDRMCGSFSSTVFNHRTDEYGGSIENRFRMTEEIIRGIQEACGEDFPVLLKVNVDTKAEDAEGYHRDMVWLLQRAKALGVELVEFSGVDFINQPKTATLYYLPQIKRLHEEVPDMPLSLVGGVRSLADMETVIEAGIACVSLGRALIAEPDFVTKELSGGEKSICLSCSRCFVLPHMHPGIRCVWVWKKERAKMKTL